MTEKDFRRFSKALGVLTELFDKKLSPVAIKAYFNSLDKFTINQVEAAISQSMVKCRFFPKPVELIEMITGGQKQIEDRGLVEAHKIVSHLQAYGAKYYPQLDDKISQRLMSRRWPYHRWAASVLESELKWWVKDFTEAYNAYTSTEEPLKIEAGPKIKKLTEGMLKTI